MISAVTKGERYFYERVATGEPTSTTPYLVFLRAKYGELYRLDLAP